MACSVCVSAENGQTIRHALTDTAALDRMLAEARAAALREAADACDPLTTATPLGFTSDVTAHWLRHRAEGERAAGGDA